MSEGSRLRIHRHGWRERSSLGRDFGSEREPSARSLLLMNLMRTSQWVAEFVRIPAVASDFGILTNSATPWLVRVPFFRGEHLSPTVALDSQA